MVELLLLLLQEGLQVFLLILARVGALLAVAPFWGSRIIPVQVRVCFTLILSLALLPLVWQQQPAIPAQFLSYSFLVVREVLFGLVLGLASLLLFSAIQVAGQIIDTQMGFGMVNVLDPQSRVQVPLVGNLFYLVAIILFLLTDGHHYFLEAVAGSFILIPPGAPAFPLVVWADLTALFSQVLALALRIALPVAGVLLLADLALGIIARAVPQMNVFILGLPGKIIIGTLAILVILPLYTFLLKLLFRELFHNLDLLLKVLRSNS